ncbi:hypothetical protein LUX01_10220 [Streptomyces sudanensis]|uniref:hypothetical protein n=1 Tax=Streptomyces sudanensis TaxID=436397 RepID=UPI0020CF8F61|nr:hypothetical protein [Streptomyces sudanensis]MCP9987020.1 hypothetical protein [Streptomyces sudanensis]
MTSPKRRAFTMAACGSVWTYDSAEQPSVTSKGSWRSRWPKLDEPAARRATCSSYSPGCPDRPGRPG